MKRMGIDGIPVLPFTWRLSARHWDFTTSLEKDVDGRQWSVTLSPRSRLGAANDPRLWVRVHIERADGRVEGLWNSPESRMQWTYSRTVNLDENEPPPSLVMYKSLIPRRLAFVRRRLRDAK